MTEVPSGVVTGSYVPITGHILSLDPLVVIGYGTGPASCSNCGASVPDVFGGRGDELIAADTVCSHGCGRAILNHMLQAVARGLPAAEFDGEEVS